MASIFSFIQNHLNSLNHFTELLESCDWDEEILNEKIETLNTVFEVLPMEDIAVQGFENWLQSTLLPVLELNGYTSVQAKIVEKVILSNRDELMLYTNNGEINE